MPTDYDKIREDNIREYGQGTRHLSFLGRLYTDRTHFVFELLQNAEDAGATRILFSLFDDRLEVTHDGRLFNERDVRGVCGVGEGTKAEDLTQIGKFGIGFKSVYAYTATPEVHSGGEGFRIENYVRPYAVTSKPAGNSWTTLFVFPFNTEEIAPETACKEIGTRLRNLSARTLLFLRRINEIEYRLPNSTGGVYLREEIARGPARQVSVIGQNNGKDEEENWLIFEQPVTVPGSSETVCVEVSFRLEAEDKAGKNPERIVKVKDSPLVVYFPTEKETRFGFLIQGPYRTTPSRDNIPKDNEWNEALVKETAQLIRDILPQIKNLGLLSVSFLEVLPIRIEDFPGGSMFYPIVESVRNALLEDELLPADDGSYISARNAKLARGADLRKILNHAQLHQLFQSSGTITKWLSGDITQDKTPDLRTYLTDELDIEELTPDGLARKIQQPFLSAQSDEWFIIFYRYLSGQEALWRNKGHHYLNGPLRHKPIIRCDDGETVVAFDNSGTPLVFLPTDSMEIAEYPIIKRTIYEDKESRDFLNRFGLSVPDICTRVLNDILPCYDKDDGRKEEYHRNDLKIIRDALNLSDSPRYSEMFEALKNTDWILGRNAVTGEEYYCSAGELFIPTRELQFFFDKNADIYFLAEEEDEMWKKLGIKGKPVSHFRKPHYWDGGFVMLHSSHGWHKRGVDGFDPDAEIEGLEHALKNITKEKAIFIWNELLPPFIKQLRGSYQTATHQNFDNATSYNNVDSKLGKILKSNDWIPVENDGFKLPSDCSVSDLDSELQRNDRLAMALGISIAQQPVDQVKEDNLAEERKVFADHGVSLEDIEFLKAHRDEIEQLKADIAARKEPPKFPTRSVPNPRRRKERLAEQINGTQKKKYEKRQRSVRATNNVIDPTTWLRNQYTNDADQMVCQICKEEMPFRKRDGAHYFEKKEVLSRKYLPKEHEAQYLALCPLCAAKYDEFVKTDDEVMAELREEIVSAEDYEISISLGDEQTSIRFVETHLHDLKVIMDEAE